MIYKRFKQLFFFTLTAGAIFGCTIAVVAESENGTPLLWKNRDVHNVDQEVRYFDTTPYRFVANVYRGETHRAWAGINEAGFAIVNTDTYNQGSWGTGGLDDGEIMFWSLSNCLTVGDFQDYLDSTNTTVRRSTHCYGVIDAFGGAIIYEAGRYDYERYDAWAAPGGYLVRTNYADCGSDSLVGEERRLRAEEIISLPGSIDAYLFLYILARDLVLHDFDPYPLPFSGVYDTLPSGIISTKYTLNRYYTSSSSVIQGVGKSECPGVLWEYLGQPIVSIPVPIWVQAGEVPAGLCSSTGSELCHMANEFKSLVYTSPTTVNTYPLAELLDFYFDTEERIYHDVEELYLAGPSAFADSSNLAATEHDFVDRVTSIYYDLRELFVREYGNSLPSGAELDIYPNPFNGTGSVNVFVHSPVIAEVRLYNMTGHLAATPLNSRLIFAGKTTIRLTTESLQSGIYFASLLLDGQVSATTKVVIVE